MLKEFDSLDELRQFDERYLVNADSAIIDNICKTLKCVASDIVNIKPLKDGLTNTSFSFDCLGKDMFTVIRVGERKIISTELVKQLLWKLLQN